MYPSTDIEIIKDANIQKNIKVFTDKYNAAFDGDLYLEFLKFQKSKGSKRKYGSLSSFGVNRGSITQQDLDHYNQRFIVGCQRCKEVFGDFSMLGIIMLLGKFSPMDCWVSAYQRAQSFASSQYLSGFESSQDSILDQAEDNFYSLIDDMHAKREELIDAGIIKENTFQEKT